MQALRRLSLFTLFLVPCTSAASGEKFPAELTRFEPVDGNPVFAARGPGHWDVKIRERGYILRDGDRYHLWFTGYDGTRAGLKMLGYATSADGVDWKRHPDNPVYKEHWVEDMMVVKQGGRFHMFAEGKGDEAQLLTSPDGVDWKRVGRLDVRMTNGRPIDAGPYGTPTAWYEKDTWYLFYERRDAGVWLAKSRDLQTWRNVSDKPVLSPGQGPHDEDLIALNQIIRHRGRYYASYHGTKIREGGNFWTSNLAVSDDLIHWTKYPGNPLQPLNTNKSSNIFVHDGRRFLLYTMHDQVHLHLPAASGR